jgi:hypothetical protein
VQRHAPPRNLIAKRGFFDKRSSDMMTDPDTIALDTVIGGQHYADD